MLTNRKKNINSIGLLIMVLISLSYLLYGNTIQLFPAFVHSWTQSERYALSLGFLNNNFDFFHPCTYNLQTLDGITRVDFPINEYIVAILMKILGTTSPIIFRIYTLSISIIGCVFLFLLTKKITHSDLKAWALSLFVFLSPLYVYYQAGFIPSVPAISFTIIAYYYYFSYQQSKKSNHYIFAICFFLLAALIRIPFLIYIIAILLHQTWIALKNKKVQFQEFIILILSLILFSIYYRYNVHLGRMYGNIFLDNFLPARNWEEFKIILKQMTEVWMYHYFNKAHYFLLILSISICTITFIKRKTLHASFKFYWFHFFIILCGTVLYFLLMMRQYYDHDYYFLDSLFVPTMLLLLFSIEAIAIKTKQQKIVAAIIIIAINCSAYIDTKRIQKERYTIQEWDRVEISRQHFIGSDVYLDSIGIDKNAKILVIESYSTNIPLILMNRKGYTVYQTNRDDAFLPLIKHKWDYVVIQDQFLVSDVLNYYPIIASMLEKINGNGKISVYKRKDNIKFQSLKTFLNINTSNILYEQKINFDTPLNTEYITGQTNTSSENAYSKPNSGILNSQLEYGTSLVIKGNQFEKKAVKTYVTFQLFATDKLKGLQLVSAITKNDSVINYQSVDVNKFIKDAQKWTKMEMQFVTPPLGKEEKLSIYLWNKDKEIVYYDDLEFIVYQ